MTAFKTFLLLFTILTITLLSGCSRDEKTNPNEPRDFFGRTGGDVLNGG